jgi:hypothetical protein
VKIFCGAAHFALDKRHAPVHIAPMAAGWSGARDGETKMTNAPMFSPETADAAADYWTAAEAVIKAITPQVMAGLDSDSELVAQMRDAINDAVNNAFRDGMSHDEWCAAALRGLGA